MKILGIHDGHNAAACLLEDGIIKGVIQEERIVGVKNVDCLPYNAIKSLLTLTNTTIEDIDYVAMNGNHMPYPIEGQEGIKRTYRNFTTFKVAVKRVLKKTPVYDIFKKRRRIDRLKDINKIGIPESKVVFVEHHEAHAAAAYYGCPWWKNEKLLVLTNDGAGDGLCATANIGEDGRLKRICEIPESESIAWYYAMITFLLGMVPLEHEYKVMGLAPYAPEGGKKIAYKKFSSLMEFPSVEALLWQRNPDVPPAAYSYGYAKKITELIRFDSLSAGLQQWVEEMLREWVSRCVKKTGIKKIALSGGIFMNVKANKVISELPEVEDMFIFPSCGDESNSIGAAFSLYAKKSREIGNEPEIKPIKDIYFGPDINDSQVEEMIGKTHENISFEYSKDVDEEIGKLLGEGEIVARCKGKMEFGARALGNRSILADPSALENIKVINDMIKKRDFWMPFASTILKEREKDYIINPKNIEAPYMILSFDTADKRNEIIAAIHQADFTVRPQVLEKDWNPGYYKVVKEFEKQTGIGAVLNTSFNIHGEPIVCTVGDAFHVFLNSGLGCLALGNYIIRKEG